MSSQTTSLCTCENVPCAQLQCEEMPLVFEWDPLQAKHGHYNAASSSFTDSVTGRE